MARPRFLLTERDGDTAWLRGPQAAHLARVLRGRPGQEVEIVHAGVGYLARIATLGAEGVRLDVIAPLPEAAPTVPLQLAPALFKFDRFEWMLEKACELGATRIAPLVTQRTDARASQPSAARRERWRRILSSAAEQCHRSQPPELAEPQPLAAFLQRPAGPQGWILSERGGAAAGSLFDGPAEAPATLLTGPEGGWVEAELTAAAQAGYRALSLGPYILRCETAVLAGLVLVGAAIRGDREHPPD